MDVAAAEFAARGLAGARVEVIAAGARCSAGLVYAHFGSKAGLFDAVLHDLVERSLDQVPFAVDDLPGYAARVYDATAAAPDVQRLLAWHHLERGAPSSPGLTEATRERVDVLAAAQRAGTVADRMPAPELLLAVQTIARMWSAHPTGLFSAVSQDEDHAVRRQAVRSAVTALVAT